MLLLIGFSRGAAWRSLRVLYSGRWALEQQHGMSRAQSPAAAQRLASGMTLPVVGLPSIDYPLLVVQEIGARPSP